MSDVPVRDKDAAEKALSNIINKYRKYFFVFMFFKMAKEEFSQISLSFTEFANLMNLKLPDSAYKHKAWWFGAKHHKHTRSWIDAGWEIQNVFLPSEIVIFCRKGEKPVQDIPQYISFLLGENPKQSQPPKLPAQQIYKWISFCRRVGWYFEGVILYEKCGFNPDALDEIERAEVEEDYRMCKKGLNKYKESEAYSFIKNLSKEG